jgi:hypothetical protein
MEGRRDSGEKWEVEQEQPDMAAVAAAWIISANRWWIPPAECGREAKCFGWLSGVAAREPRKPRFCGLPWTQLVLLFDRNHFSLSLSLFLFLFAVERPELFLIKDNVFNLELKNTPDLPKVVSLGAF